jgi:hypothetical protein
LAANVITKLKSPQIAKRLKYWQFSHGIKVAVLLKQIVTAKGYSNHECQQSGENLSTACGNGALPESEHGQGKTNAD